MSCRVVFSTFLLLLSLFMTGCSTTGLTPQQAAQVESRRRLIAMEPRGDFYIGRRFYLPHTHFWGYLRSPGQDWSTSRLVIMNERYKNIPNRLPELPTDGGYVVDGRWEWATASAHGDWLLAHAIEDGPGFRSRFVVVPMADVAVHDVWFTSGMRATRSNTVSLDGVFVIEQGTIDASELMNSTATVDGDGLAGLPVVSVLALVAAAPALGGAEGVAAHYRERLRERVLAYTLGDKAVEQPAAQIRLATVDDLVATASARWRQAIDALTNTGAVGLDERVDARLAAASTVRMARTAISTAGEGAGASVYFSDHPIQRIQRDVETLKGHVIFDWDRTTELAGRHRLGLEPRPTDMV